MNKKIQAGDEILKSLGYYYFESYRWHFYYSKTVEDEIFSITADLNGINKESISDKHFYPGVKKRIFTKEEEKAANLIVEGLNEEIQEPTKFTEEEKKKYHIKFDEGYIFEFYDYFSFESFESNIKRNNFLWDRTLSDSISDWKDSKTIIVSKDFSMYQYQVSFDCGKEYFGDSKFLSKEHSLIFKKEVEKVRGQKC